MGVSWIAVASLMLSFAPCYAERSDPERIAHVELQAKAIASVSETPSDASALISIGKHEGNFCWSVAIGRIKGGPGEGPWQLEPGSRRSRPFSGNDLTSLSHAAGEALWLWRHSHQCGSSAEARFRSYAGLSCESRWSGAASRARVYYWSLWKLNQAEKQGAH